MTDRPETSSGRQAEPAGSGVVFSTSRLEAFSDGVFAIAITLLVLDLAVGAAAHRHLLHALVDLWPSYLAYVTSFFMIGLVWMGHHVIISLSTRIDRRLLKINVALLLVVAFLPFPTRLLGQFIRDPHAERVAAVFYGLWLLLISVTLNGMWRYVSGNHRLLPEDFSQARIDRITRIFQPTRWPVRPRPRRISARCFGGRIAALNASMGWSSCRQWGRCRGRAAGDAPARAAGSSADRDSHPVDASRPP